MKATSKTLFTVAALAVLLSVAATSASEFGQPGEAQGDPADQCLAPYFKLDGGESSLEQFPLRSTETHVTIAGVIAAVEVKQVYANQGAGPIEAIYIFPASTRAAVHGMEMKIGGRRIRARIRERQEAKASYEKAKSEHKTASLLEQQRPNVFEMSVANILPGDEVEVTLRYSEILTAEDGVYEFVYPTVVGPRYSNRSADSPDAAHHAWVANPYLAEGEDSPSGFSFALDMQAGMPIQSLTCPSHQAPIKFTGESSAQVNLSGNAAADRDVIIRYQLADRQIASGLLLHEGEGENFFLLNVQPPERVRPEHIPPRDYVFVVDVSGSMNGFPLDLAKHLFKDLIGSLRPEDSFNILLFAGSSQSMSSRPLPATPGNVRKGIEFLERRGGGGGTELIRALRNAIDLPGHEDRSRSMIVITDGFVSMEAEAFQLLRNKLGQANLFAFGIGSSVNRHLIEGLARVGHGEPFVVTRPAEAEPVAARLRDYISSPVLTNIKVTPKGLRLENLEPHSPPDVFASRPLTLTGKYHGKSEGSIVVSGLTGNGQTFQQEFQLAAAAEDGVENPALPSLWARERVRALADYAALSEDDEAVKEVTNLGLTYELMTKYTSFVAIDEVVREFAGQAQSVKQPLPLPQGVAASAVGGSASSGSHFVSNGSLPEPGPVSLFLATLSFILFIRNRRTKE
jgi:Ca-activated chloride channel family protein